MKMSNCRMMGIVAAAAALLGLCTERAEAQTLKINTRPLTPQEIKDYGLAASTQTANGTPVVGLGQPVYLELLVSSGTVVTQATWTLEAVIDEDGDPLVSSATIAAGPLGMSIPTYDVGDRNSFTLVDRAMIVPDVKGTFKIKAVARTATATLNTSRDIVGSVFVGKDNYLCVLCHATKMAPFNMTDHANAFKNQINGEGSDHFNPNCIKCHVVGYDAAPGAVNGGFDDVATSTGWTFPESLSTNNWDAMPAALKAKSNIQCESCHGPADEHIQSLGDVSKIGVSISAGNCGQCHDSMPHHVKNYEWEQTLHASGYAFRSTGSCAPCHSTKGYIDANDPGMNELDEIVATRGTGNEGITCAACHDPHSPGAGAHQLRTIESVTLSNGDVIADGGDGLVCMACHHDRRNAEEYVLTNRGGPHHGTQADMLFGRNAIEYGQDLPTSRHWDVVEDTCAQCHMQATPANVPAYAKNKVGGHTFMLGYDDGTNAAVRLTGTCTSCHGEIEDFNFGGADFDLDGMVEGVQQEISDMLYDLALLLPPYGVPEVNTSLISNTSPGDLGLRRGAYNYLFVTEDGSLGVHNPKYTAALLRSSIDDLKGGIDIDRDGLVDSWEIENFGNLTSQAGKGDDDGDGLTNIEEYNLGTDPALADSDGDGFSDLAEAQAGSNPLVAGSVPTSDLVLLPAAEIGYLPSGTNAVVQFQSIDSLAGGGWSDLGPVQTNSGGWSYQLDTMRGTSNRFYRAVEE